MRVSGPYGTFRTLVVVITWLIAALPAIAVAQQASVSASGDEPPVRRSALAVAPFTNISANPADDWIGAGIAETVSADLQRLGAARIIGRDAIDEAVATGAAGLAQSGAAADADRAAQEAGRRLGAAWLVTGGYQRLGDRLRITARLIDTATGAVAASVRADGVSGEIFGLQDRIAAELGAALAARMGGRVAADAAAEGTARSRAPRAGLAAGSGNGNGNGNGNGLVAGGIVLGDPEDAAEAADPSGAAAGPASAAAAPGASAPAAGPGSAAARPGAGAPAVGFAAGAGILTGRPTMRPPRAEERPAIDGRLDDAVWRNALHVTEFVQQQPLEGAPATEATDLWVAYDSEHLYLAIHAHYEDPGIMRATRVDRDQAYRDDNITVYFDPFLDQQRAYAFSVNGYGVQGDEIIHARGRSTSRSGRRRTSSGFSSRGIPWGDDSWDALFDSGAQLVGDGFTAEMAIPFKSLRYPRRSSDVPHRWGFQVVREIRGKDENVVWAPISRGVAGFLPQMGLLEGMTNLSTSRNLEIMPVVTGIQFGSLDTTNGDFRTGKAEPEGGVNLKYGITSNLTADVTFNPDFSQIESDRPQIEINQRFALFYPELRPFFLEGAEIFNVFGPINFVHTRTIRDPDWGGKISGKVGRMSVGFLAANDAAAGRVAGLAGPAGDAAANVVIGRARYDLYSESHLGAMVTNRDFLGSHSRMALVDGAFRLGQTQSIGLTAAQTRHRDLGGLDSRGELFDVNYRLNGRHWNIFSGTYLLSPDFRTEVGFVQRTDQKRNVTSVGYRFWPESWILNWGPSVSYGRNWNFDDVLQDEELRLSLNTSFANNISFSVSANRDMERYRGVNFRKASSRVFGRISSNRKFSIGGYYQYGDEVRYQENPFLGRGGSGAMFLTLRPVSRFQTQINLSTSRLIDPRIDPLERDPLVFDVTIVRALSTYQLNDRLALRNIVEFNTLQRTAGLNVLASYRVNAGTVFYIGYDGRYQQADHINSGDLDGDGIDDYLFPSITTLQPTNRAVFAKFQYLFRY